jgi:ribonuclease/clavin/mitogillin
VTESHALRTIQLSDHVIQFAVPTPTLPPAYETNTYLITSGEQGVIVDAGSQDAHVLGALVQEIRNHGVTDVVAIVATHYHRDHTQGMPALQQAFHAPIFVHVADLDNAKLEMNTPHLDVRPLPENFNLSNLNLSHLTIETRHAPGHTHGHVHVLIPQDGVILVGDHLAGDGSVWIGPPDGHMADYYSSLQAIADSGCQLAGPGHGAALQDAADAAHRLRLRRESRETQIVDWLQGQPASLFQIVQHLYGDTVPPEAMWVAKKTVQAHLAQLMSQHRVFRHYDETSQTFMYQS